MDAPGVSVVFFDVGNTLGELDADERLVAYVGTAALLAALRDTLRLRLGVITNVPDDWTVHRVRALLGNAGLLGFFEPHGIVTSVLADAAKPAPQIFRFAAARLGVTPAQCLFVGESADEGCGALAAGMQGLQKPPAMLTP